jgi:hypothetical protein
MAGSAAAGLTGLMFVVLSLLERRERTEATREGIATFSTPTVMHFAAAFLVSGILLMPWRSLLSAGVLVALIGLSGVAFILGVMQRTRRLAGYKADLEDWTWFVILPLGAYGAIAAGAIALATVPVQALFAIAGGVTLLIFIGIRNAWDVVTYLATRRGTPR